MTDVDLPLLDPDEIADPEAVAEGSTDGPIVDDSTDDPTATVAGVLLAAGESSRFGEANKLLATVDGEPVVHRAARTLVESALSPLVVVVGHEADRVRAVLADLPFDVVVNGAYADGQATSVRAAVEALPARVDAAVFALGDMPFVAPESVRALVTVYRAGRGSALAAAHEGRRGNPVLFDSRYFDRLADVEGDVGGRDILRFGDDSALVETHDAGVREDIDTATDLRAARDRS
jgi:molybdenum cofactor cytidylyltransferase